MAPQGGIQASAGTYLTDPAADFNTTARTMLDGALGRWFKELSGGGGNGIIYKRWQWHAVSGNRWKDTACFGEHPGDPEGDKLNQLKGIEWGPILDTAARLTNAAKFSTNEIATGISNVSLQVERAWPDKNGHAAVEKINALTTAGTKFIDSATQLGAHLNTFCVESKKCIQKIVDFAGGPNDDFFNNYLANDDHVDIAHFSCAIDYIDFHLKIGKTADQKEYNLAKARSNEAGLKIYEGWNTWYSDVEKGRLDTFCDKYRNAVSSLRRLITEAYETIDGHLQTLMTGCSSLNFKPYANLDSLGTGGEKKPEEKQPEEKKPEQKPQDHTATSASSSQQQQWSGMPPNTGDPNAAIPDTGMPDPTRTGADPGTTPSGQTPGVDPATGQPETMTIQDGDRKVAVQSPDGQGHVKLTIDDGSGNPKTYDMDFSAGTGQQPQPLPANGQPALGPTTGADGVQHAQAGPDGKVVLHDGNMTITAEHPPGAWDQVQLTVDDGTGKPTSYLLDYGDPADPRSQVLPATSDPAQPAAAAAQQSATGSAGPAMTTQTQSVALDFGGGSDAGAADTAWSTQGDLLADSGQDQVAPAGDAGLAAVPDGGGGQYQQGQGAGVMGGGMPMMGGMGGGGDQERSSGQWSVQGDLFSDQPDAGARIAGALDDEPGFDR
jgi:hypothetical protein